MRRFMMIHKATKNWEPSSKDWRVKYSSGKRTVIDGPFAETKELISGYKLTQAKSKEEANAQFRVLGPAPKK